MKAMKMTARDAVQAQVREATRGKRSFLIRLCLLAPFALSPSKTYADPIFAGSAKSNPNVEVVLSFIDIAWNKHNAQEGFSKYWIPDAFHHPGRPGDEDPVATDKFLKSLPNFHYDVKRVFADGNFVITQSLATGTPGAGAPASDAAPGDPPKAKVGDEIVDIFRLENGKVVEHWDVVQAITTLDSMF
jgi:predicted SnoaL-like aldol condensation-catalyzing enzyme